MSSVLALSGAALGAAPAPASPERARAETEDDSAELRSLRERLDVLEERTRLEEEAEAEKSDLRIGGAMWLNYAYKDFSGVDSPPGGEANLDLIRLSVDGEASDVLLSLQYRWYPYMHVVHHAWIGYQASPAWQVQAGIVRVPFGLQPYASHSYWFGIPYYLGFEDDYDAGVAIVGDVAPFSFQFAALKNAEWGVGSKSERYSFDVVPTDEYPQTELNQLNARVTWGIPFSDTVGLEVGASGMVGHLLNTETNDIGTRFAAAGHGQLTIGAFTLQLQAIRYAFRPRVGLGESDELVQLGAFAALRPVAAKGHVLVGNLAYRFAIDAGPLEAITCYNDTSSLLKNVADSEDSWLNTTGCMVVLGPTYTYVDLIQGYNTTFLNDSFDRSGLGPGSTSRVERRFNVNIEYYF